MNARALLVPLVALPFVFGACRCDTGVDRVKPVLAVSPTKLTFGEVKVGFTSELPVKLEAQVNSPVAISSLSLEGPHADAYQIVEPVEVVPELSDASFRIRFSPGARQLYEATLVVKSNDEERPDIRLPITGEGAHPILSVVPECLASKRCRGTATQDPPAIDFGEEPFQRAVMLPVTELPAIALINEGEVELALTHLAIEGPDAQAFTFAQSISFPDTAPDGSPARLIAGRAGETVSIRFKPTSEAQDSYGATVVIRSDDPDRPEVRLALTGKLGPNLPPQLCANITRVKPAGEMELRYDTKAHWDALLVPPPSGYDFTATRDVRPQSEVRFSAISDASNMRSCTTDPEDQRTGLTYAWELTETPPGAANAAIASPHTATPTFTPVATGSYEVRLTVTDAQGHASTTTLRFAAVVKEDLVVQASWNGRMNAFANVDLDVHLVRPGSELFSFFKEGGSGKTSGDINGYADRVRRNNPAQGYAFDWGDPGTADDPRLNLDEEGGGPLLENLSLNYPEHDPACAEADCTYRVYVHYFADKRQATGAPTCTVGGGCADGEVCDCTGTGERCVANLAPQGSAPTGTGRCFVAPEPQVRIFFKANPVPAAVIPLPDLMPADELAIGAPCQALYVADIIWPARNGMGSTDPRVVVRGADETGRITQPELVRYGVRAADGLQCNPNAIEGPGVVPNWYDAEPL